MSDLTKPGPLRVLMLVATGGTIAWAIGIALGPSVSRALILGMVALTVLEAEASWQLTSQREMSRQQLRSMRIAEMILGFATVKVMQLSLTVIDSGPSEALGASLFDREALVVWLICVGVWIFATGTISDLERLGSPSEPAPGYRPPLPSLTTRFLLGGIVIVVSGALALVDLPELPDPARAPALAWFWPAFLYFLVVMPVLGAIRQQETQLQWRRQNMEVAPEVRTRWWSGVGVAVGLATVMMFVVPLVRGGRALAYVYDRIVGFVAWAAGGLGISVRFGSDAPPPSETQTAEELAAGLDLEETGSLVSDAIDLATGFLFLVVMAILALAAMRLIRGLSLPLAGLGTTGVTTGIIQALWLAITAIPRLLIWAVKAFVAWLRKVTTTVDSHQDVVGPGSAAARSPGWGVDDPNRMRIAELYRQFLDMAGKNLIARRRSETPREYGTTVGGLVEEPDPVDELTDIFNEARYSRHPIVEDDVVRAAGSLESFEDEVRDHDPMPLEDV